MRYTMLFRIMIKHMATDNPERAKIVEADAIASKIARAEPDDETKRANIMGCLRSSIDGFPAALFSHSRRFIDCIDVEDVIAEAPASSSTSLSTSSTLLHCSLFLFDDKLMIVKRPSNGEKGGRVLAGLDDLDKVKKAGGLPKGKKKCTMSFKGIVELTDVVITDIGGAGKFDDSRTIL